MHNNDRLSKKQRVRRQQQLEELRAHQHPNWQRTVRSTFSITSLLRFAIFAGLIVAFVFIGRTVYDHLHGQLTAQVPTASAQFVTSDQLDLRRAFSLDNLENTLIGFYLRIRQNDIETPADATAEARVPFTVNLGEPATVVAERLQQAGFIEDAGLFGMYMRYNGIDQSLEAGDFELAPSMTMTEIAETLQQARFVEVTVTIPEGLRAEEVAEILSKANIMDGAAFLAAVRAGDPQVLGLEAYPFLADRPPGASLEGYLFPDTYRLPARAKPADVIGRMLDNFAAKVTPEVIADARSRGLNVHQLVTVASIVERETPRLDERPIVANVYLNRMIKNMLLNADPTVQYAMGYQPASGQWWKTPVLLEEYQSVQSPYNTYLYPGLPPGPIASPGLSAIEGTARPAATDYLYFVATGEGGHVFAVTPEEHAANVTAYENR